MIQTAINFAPRKLARRDNPATSHQAAGRVHEFAGGHCALILAALRDHGSMTVDQIAARTRLHSQQINKRTPEMQKVGAIRLTGSERLSASGRMERVWDVVDV